MTYTLVRVRGLSPLNTNTEVKIRSRKNVGLHSGSFSISPFLSGLGVAYRLDPVLLESLGTPVGGTKCLFLGPILQNGS